MRKKKPASARYLVENGGQSVPVFHVHLKRRLQGTFQHLWSYSVAQRKARLTRARVSRRGLKNPRPRLVVPTDKREFHFSSLRGLALLAFRSTEQSKRLATVYISSTGKLRECSGAKREQEEVIGGKCISERHGYGGVDVVETRTTGFSFFAFSTLMNGSQTTLTIS